MKKKILIRLFILTILIGLCSLYFHYENTKLQISEYNIVNPFIPNDFDKYKIVQVSDFHNAKSKTLANDLVKEIKQQKPNIIVITGDLIDANKTNFDLAINFIKEIKTISPIYFVSGNHEASSSYYVELKEELLENNVIILDNKLVKLKVNEAEINLIGIDDPKMAHENAVLDSEIVKVELSKINYDKSIYSILLSHRPELFDNYVEKDIDLVLSGHAHGGQIRLPFVRGLFAPNQGFFPKYTSGTYEKNKTTMIVSRGIGNSILPFRINNRPDLVVITLNHKELS